MSDNTRGETKAAVLEGGVECLNMLTFNMYATKLVHFLSMADDNLVWNFDKKEIYDKETKKKVKLQLYRTELQNFITIT